MKFLTIVISICLLGDSLYAQELDVEGTARLQNLDVNGEVKIALMDEVNTADAVVVRLADGTLALREYQR